MPSWFKKEVKTMAIGLLVEVSVDQSSMYEFVQGPTVKGCLNQILYFQLQDDVDLFLFRFRVFEQRFSLIDYYEAAQNPDAVTESEVV